MTAIPQDVLGFWKNAGPEKWFAHSWAFDEAIRLKFEPVHHRAARGEYDAWGAEPESALALLILLDQFPRNLYRNSAHAFATDPKARAIARKAVEAGFHHRVDAQLAPFFMLPFEHSEDVADQDFALALAIELDDAKTLEYARIHRDIIVRFGRFPHRNLSLGRETTPAEQEFLDEGGFAG
jgi:uncharacterized protein (DUF924 family)